MPRSSQGILYCQSMFMSVYCLYPQKNKSITHLGVSENVVYPSANCHLMRKMMVIRVPHFSDPLMVDVYHLVYHLNGFHLVYHLMTMKIQVYHLYHPKTPCNLGWKRRRSPSWKLCPSCGLKTGAESVEWNPFSGSELLDSRGLMVRVMVINGDKTSIYNYVYLVC